MALPRILVGPLPRLLRDLVCGLANVSCADVGEEALATLDTLVDAAVRVRADVVVAAIEHEADATRASSALAQRVPGAALVRIDARGRDGTRYVAGTVVLRADDLSPDSLRLLL